MVRDVRAVIAANRVTEIFNILDTDGDGTINQRLLNQVLTSLGGPDFAGRFSATNASCWEPRVRLAAFLTDVFGEGAAPAVAAAQCLKLHGVAEPCDEDVAYVEAHGLVQLVGDLLRRWLEMKPSDPKRFAAEHFMSGLRSTPVPISAPEKPADDSFGTAASSSSSSTPLADLAAGAGRAFDWDAFAPAAAASPALCSTGGHQDEAEAEAACDERAPSWSTHAGPTFASPGGNAPEMSIQVTMAASGQHVCDARLAGDANIWQLKLVIRDQYKEIKSCFQQRLIVGARVLGDAELVQDVFASTPAGEAAVQLICQPPEEFVEELREFRKKLSAPRNPPIQQAIDAGVVPRFIQYLKETTWPQVQFEASWALTNICSGSTEQTRVVMDHGAVPIFIELLRSPDIQVRGQAIWALGNIAGDSTQFRDTVLCHGAMEPTLEMLRAMEPATMENTAWALANYIRGKPRPDLATVSPALEVFAWCIERTEDAACLSEMSWGLSYIADISDDAIRLVIETGLLRRMVGLLQHASSTVQTPALRTLGSLVTGDDQSTQAVLDAGLIDGISQIMDHTKAGIRKEACWTLSNITAGTHSQIQEVIDAGMVPRLLQVMRADNAAISKEAAFAIHNIVQAGTTQQVLDVVGAHDYMPAAVHTLEVGEAKVMCMALGMIKTAMRTSWTQEQRAAARDLALELGADEKCEALLHQQHNDHLLKLANEVLTLLTGDEAHEEGDFAFNFGHAGFGLGHQDFALPAGAGERADERDAEAEEDQGA